jgi:hypothetical protein
MFLGEIVKSALHVEFSCLASLCATCFDEFIGYAKVPKEGWRYVALCGVSKTASFAP